MDTRYLHWSKVHPHVRYELTNSGIPSAEWSDLDIKSGSLELASQGPYGHPDLIQAIATRYGVNANGVVPVPGASSGIFIALAATAGRGDIVALEHPIYEPIARSAGFLGLTILWLPRRPDECFGLRMDKLQDAVRRGARAIFLTNLHNPSGQLLSQNFLVEAAGICAAGEATLILDEAYLDAVCLNGDQPLWTSASLASNVVAINSLTKVYGLSGLRAGWLLSNAKIADRAREIMNLLSVNNSAPSTALALRAFERMAYFEERFRRYFREGQPIFRRWLHEEKLLSGYPNHGALFECLRLPRGISSRDLHELLVSRYETQVTPGAFFELDDHIRLTLSLAALDLGEALQRLTAAVRKLVKI